MQKGIYHKYHVTKADDGSPVIGFCFVLRPDRDAAARRALREYARATPNSILGQDIDEYLDGLAPIGGKPFG
jgi:hypothetical protein